ncbi:unnamed protein product [Ixodes persulcatus]
MPMMHLESSLAQFSGDGNRGIFSTVPLFIGLGYTMSLYAILHIVGDSVAMSDYLMYFLTSLKSAPWTDCPEGWPTHNRTCYPIRQNATLCRSVRHRLMDTFRRQQFSQGIPLTSGDLVVLVPPKSYRDAAAGCVPGLYGPLQSFYMRRQNDWMESSFSQIQAQPLISLAAVWMLVFALAHRGFNKIKRFFYLMVVLYLVTTAMLLMRGFMLTGAMEGLGMFLYTDWSSMINLELIVPDIIIEVLSASHPPLLVNRTMVHFFICLFLLMTSIVVCSPGGASIAAIIFHNHDQYVRFVILMLESLGLRNCLIPLPTWTPSNWEQTMLHRQVAMAEGFNRTQEEQRFAELPPNISVSQEKHTELSTTGATATEVLGTHLVVAGEGTFVTPGTSSWRYDSLDELETKKKDARATANAMPESGTLHVSRKISSILNIVRKPIDTSQKGKASSRRSVTVAPSSEKKPKSKSKKIPVGNLGKGSSTSTTGTVAGQTAVDSEGRLLVLVPPLDVMALPDAAPGPEAPPAPPAVAALPAKRTKRKKVRTTLA